MSTPSSYRRSSWVHYEKPHDKRQDSVTSRSRSANSPDFGPENFSYDPAYLPQWKVPDGIMNKDKTPFPAILRVEINDWSLAGAALCTALDRIARLKKDAVHRGWPRGRSLAFLSHSTSAGSPASSMAASDSSSPVVSPMLLPTSLKGDRASLTQQPSPPSSQSSSANAASGIVPPLPTPIGLESPPVGPKGSSTPAYLSNDAKAVLPDLSKLPLDLPIGTPRFPALEAATVDSPGHFDENAWETYLKSYQAELSDIRTHAFGRLKGFTRTIDRLVVEYGGMNEFRAGIASFETWWPAGKAQVAAYEERVKALEAPDLEDVKKERLKAGLPV